MNRSTKRSNAKMILWGQQCSAWSGKIRSFLTKKGIDFEERLPAESYFRDQIVPLIGYFVIPVVELQNGVLLQDSTETMVYLEQNRDYPSLVPETPVQRTVAWILNFFGSDGFAKPGMHYRWGFPQNSSSLAEDFIEWTSAASSLGERRKETAVLMERYGSYRPMLGITPETIPSIESSWLRCLDVLDAHFALYPYVLGGRPSIGDCGLMTWFYAHLSRDPCPSKIMKEKAPNVFRWTKRMNCVGFVDADFPNAAPDYYPNDQLPDTLVSFIRYLFSDGGPEVRETIFAYNRWMKENPNFASGDVLKPEGSQSAPHPGFSWIEYGLRGTTIKRMGFIDTVYQVQEVAKIVDALEETHKKRLREALGSADYEWILNLRPQKSIKYELYQYVLS